MIEREKMSVDLVVWCVKVMRILVHEAQMPLKDAAQYALIMTDDYYFGEHGVYEPREAIEEDMQYWS